MLGLTRVPLRAEENNVALPLAATGRVWLTFLEHREPEYPPRQAQTFGRTHRLPYRHVCSQ